MSSANATLRKDRKRNSCQVEGCPHPLPTVTLYHRRYRVCAEHATQLSMTLDGAAVRFCQQCGRFQPLGDFDAARRSCRRKLLMHNAQRKRARDAAKAARTTTAFDGASSPVGSTATVFKLRRGPAQAATCPFSEPATPACSPPTTPVASVSAHATQGVAIQSITTMGGSFAAPDIDEFDIDEFLQSLDAGASVVPQPSGFGGAAGGALCGGEAVSPPPALLPLPQEHAASFPPALEDGTSVALRPRGLGVAAGGALRGREDVPPPPPPLPLPQERAGGFQTVMPGFSEADVLPHFAVPPADLSTLLQPSPVVFSAFLLGGMPFFAPQQSLMPLMPLAPAAPAPGAPATQPAELVVVVPAENITQIFGTTAP